MKKLKRFWQGICLTVLAVILLTFIDFMRMSPREFIVLILFAVNIVLEFMDICTEE